MIKAKFNYLILGSNLAILILMLLLILGKNPSSLFRGRSNIQAEHLDHLHMEESIATAGMDMAPMKSFSSPQGRMKSMAAAPAAPSSSASAIGSLLVSSASASTNRKNLKYLIKNGNIRGRVESIEKTKEGILEVLKKHDAYIFSENESNSNYSKNLNLSIKVPAEKFDTTLNDLSKLSVHLDSKSSDLRDVMKQFVETEERIKNQNILREKFRKLITQSRRVEDTLKIEQQLSSIQTQIEYSKKILNNLKDQIAVSTIHANFYEQKPVSSQKAKLSFLRQIFDALSGGWNKLRGSVLFIISIWPFILITLGVIFSVKFYRKKRNS